MPGSENSIARRANYEIYQTNQSKYIYETNVI